MLGFCCAGNVVVLLCFEHLVSWRNSFGWRTLLHLDFLSPNMLLGKLFLFSEILLQNIQHLFPQRTTIFKTTYNLTNTILITNDSGNELACCVLTTGFWVRVRYQSGPYEQRGLARQSLRSLMQLNFGNLNCAGKVQN